MHHYPHMPHSFGAEFAEQVVWGALILIVIILSVVAAVKVFFWVCDGVARMSSGPEETEAEPRTARRSPVRLLYSAAFERLTDEELKEIRSTAPDLIPRLHRAAQLLSRRQTDEAEALLLVLRGVVRRSFGEGQHWLEAIILADLAALWHHANKAEDAQQYFERAAHIAAPWMARYPWLRSMCTARRLIRF